MTKFDPEPEFIVFITSTRYPGTRYQVLRVLLVVATWYLVQLVATVVVVGSLLV